MSKTSQRISRRRFLQAAGASGLASAMMLYGGCGAPSGRRARSGGSRPRVIVIGIDGLDPVLCERLMQQGKLPNMRRLRDANGYRRLGTSIPPQSPVAWANFITGADAGVHGIFDFIHRNPAEQCMPYFAAAETIEGVGGWSVGRLQPPAHDLAL